MGSEMINEVNALRKRSEALQNMCYGMVYIHKAFDIMVELFANDDIYRLWEAEYGDKQKIEECKELFDVIEKIKMQQL